MTTLQGKVAVITGGSRGLGLAIAQAYAQEGAAVVIGGRSQASIKQAIEAIRCEGGEAGGISCDVSDLEQVQSLAQYAFQQYGQLDIWVNNAGTGAPIGPTIHIFPQHLKEVIDTNITGVCNGTIVAMRHFLHQGRGKLINISGRGERTPTPMFNPYGASKSWLYSFTLSLAKEYKDSGVGIFLFQPGLVKSDMMGHLYFIEGYDIELLKVFRVIARLFALPPELPARKAVWLASSATDGKTGLHVNLLGPRTMLKGIGGELGRIVRRQPPPPLNSKVTLVAPAISFPEKSPVCGVATQATSGTRSKNVRQSFRHTASEVKAMKYITTIHQTHVQDSIGNKAASLHLLWKKGYITPKTFVCTWDAYLDYLRQDDKVLDILRQELSQVLSPERGYAVRSSANIEDSLEHSFAGQFSTYLDVHGIDEVLEAIQDVWRASRSQSVGEYLNRMDGKHLELKMAVIIQEMVPAVLSGVSFSKNPITTLDEVIVEAVEGQGTALVQEGITPLRWVNKWGGWIITPENSPLPIQVIEQIVRQTKKISRDCEKDVDLEWVFDGQQIYWLQLRVITSINMTLYSNRMAKEMTPGLVQPLVWSVTVPIPSQAWVNLISEVIGKNNLDPSQLMRSFHYRAYHNMTVFGQIFESLGLPRESLEMMLGIAPPGAGKPPMKPSLRTMRRIPSLIGFIYDKWTLAPRLEKYYPRLCQQTYQIPLHPSEERTAHQLLETIDKVRTLNLELTYYTVVTVILMQLYNRMLRRRLEKMGVDIQQFDLTAGMEELNNYDPTVEMQALHQEYLELPQAIRAAVESGEFQALQDLSEAEAFNRHFSAFLDKFGHLSDTTGHFGSPPWRETPGLILQWIAKYQAPETSHQARMRYEDLPKRSLMLRLFYQRARQFRLYREQYSLLYSYSLMLFRAYYLAVGERFTQRGILEQASDILFLYDDEVRAAISGHSSGSDFTSLVAARQQEYEQDRDAILPDMIFGEVAPLILRESACKLNGVPTSKGYYTGRACIICSLNDFEKLEDGDVLIIPFSDVSWTPLFAKAGAVVAESGGILSHSSIIAREFNIPAVVSVAGALQLEDGAQITVDGFRGEVLIHETLPVAFQTAPQETDDL